MIERILKESTIDFNYDIRTGTLVFEDEDLYIWCKFFESNYTFNCNIDTNLKINKTLIENLSLDLLELRYYENIPLELFKESPNNYKKNIERLKNNIKNY
jgi:hypothetical protein